MEFVDKPETQKGMIAEGIIDDWLSKKGYNVYVPSKHDRSHPFDMLCINRDRIFIADSKAKAARRKYPDTGIDKRHYEKYCDCKKKLGIDAFLFFVDEESGQIYGNFMDKLDRLVLVEDNSYPEWYKRKSVLAFEKYRIQHEYPYRYNWGGKLQGVQEIYFWLGSMVLVSNLSDTQILELKRLTTKNDIYLPG